MGHDSSLYEAPKSAVQTDSKKYYEINLANRWRRFLNLLIDYVAFIILSAIIGVLIALIWGLEGIEYIESIPDVFIGIPILLSYYIFFESVFGRTLGKFVTGTRVVNEEGANASFGQILGRSFSRMIPFEALSFFGQNGGGWHDKFPKTYVINIRK